MSQVLEDKMLQVLVHAIECIANIFVTSYLDNKVEYETTKNILSNKLNQIQSSIESIRIKDLMASLEHFKIALLTLKYKKIICKNVKKNLERARELAILGFETALIIENKLIITKIIIASSILLYYNDKIALNINLSYALDRLLKQNIIRETVANECRGNFTIWKEYRHNFVNKLRDLVNFVHKYQMDINKFDQLINDEKTNDCFTLIPLEFNNFSTNFLFWKRLNIDGYANSICVINGKSLLVGIKDGIKWFENNFYYEKGSKIEYTSSLKTQTVQYIEQLSEEEIFVHAKSSCGIMSVHKKEFITVFDINNGYEWIFSLNITIGKVYPLTNKKFINIHPNKKTIVNINEHDPKLITIEDIEDIKGLGYYSNITNGCILNDGSLIVNSNYQNDNGYFGFVLLLTKTKKLHNLDNLDNLDNYWNTNHKISFNEFILGLHILDNNHVLVITRYNVYVIYPYNEPNKSLTKSNKQKWTYKKITSISGNDYNKINTKIRICKNIILLGDYNHFKIIQRSNDNPIEYNIQEIYGTTAQIIDIDMFDDKKICTLDKKGQIIIWFVNSNLNKYDEEYDDNILDLSD
jgi:hypothetical protein